MVDPTNYYPIQMNTLYNFTEVIEKKSNIEYLLNEIERLN